MQSLTDISKHYLLLKSTYQGASFMVKDTTGKTLKIGSWKQCKAYVLKMETFRLNFL